LFPPFFLDSLPQIDVHNCFSLMDARAALWRDHYFSSMPSASAIALMRGSFALPMDPRIPALPEKEWTRGEDLLTWTATTFRRFGFFPPKFVALGSPPINFFPFCVFHPRASASLPPLPLAFLSGRIRSKMKPLSSFSCGQPVPPKPKPYRPLDLRICGYFDQGFSLRRSFPCPDSSPYCHFLAGLSLETTCPLCADSNFKFSF